VVWDKKSIPVIELTVPFELCFEVATIELRKLAKYSELVDSCRKAGYGVNLITIEVGSREFINASSFDALYAAFPAKRAEQGSLEKEVIRVCLLHSYRIWCKRNWREPATT
jgi:hypothetical protein